MSAWSHVRATVTTIHTRNMGSHIMTTTHSTGDEGEEWAAEFLRKKGYRIIERNYRFGRGDIDIIARDGTCIVFVEVKLRRNNRFGPAVSAITPAKQKQVVHLARGYLWARQIESAECRFDAVLIDIIRGEPVVTHITDAFRDG